MATVAGCCLCGIKITDRRRKRRLHGQSCSELKENLQSLSSVPLESLAETYDQDAYLCNSCENELISIRNLEKKVGELKAGIVGRLSKLHPVFSIFRVEPQKSIAETRKTIAETRKRTLEESSEVQPAQKRTPPMASGGESMLYSDESHPQAHQEASGLTAGPSASPDVQVI